MIKTFLAALTLAATSFAAFAQAWPDKPVRFVVPYAPGGTTDFSARLVAEALSQQTGKSFFVENKAGASGTIGTQQVAKSAPDGTTFLINDTTYAMLPSLFAKLPWDHAGDLVPVTTLSVTPVVLVVRELAVQERAGTVRACTQEPGQAQLRVGRQRQLDASFRRGAEEGRQALHHAHSVQGCG